MVELQNWKTSFGVQLQVSTVQLAVQPAVKAAEIAGGLALLRSGSVASSAAFGSRQSSNPAKLDVLRVSIFSNASAHV